MGFLGLAYRTSYKLGLISMISSTYIRSIPIIENVESLIPVLSSKKIIAFCPDENTVLVRKTVLDKLIAASAMLPNGLKLKILYGYRSIGVQAKFWEEVCRKIRQNNPDLTTQEIKKKARLLSAMPNGKGPHQTGGAVDVLIEDKNGSPLDFGAEYRGCDGAVFMHSKSIIQEQKKTENCLEKL